jgi:NMT1-like family
LLAKVATMASGTRQGGRPIFVHLDLGKLGRGSRRGAVWAAAGLALAVVLAGGDLAADPAKIPYGMVPYSHPVYKNGKRMLWHGAWRGSLGRYARQGAKSAEIKPALALAPEPQPQPGVAKEFTVLADPGDARASRMARDFAGVMTASGSPGRAIVGATSPNGLGKILKTDMADFAIVSLDSLLSSAKGDLEWMKRAPFVARLAPETLAVIAPREVKSINDLQGKTVSFGDLDSATSTSGRMLFSRLGVTANQTNEPLPEALDRLAAGKVDAVVVLGAEEAPSLNDFGGDGRFHIVNIPWSPTFEPVYAPAHITAADRPNLVSAINPVETIGEPMALVALDAAAGSPRADALGRVTRAFFDNYDGLLRDDRDPHWRDVNLAADPSWPTGPWPRLAAAQSWLDAKKPSADGSLDAFRASAKSATDSAGWPSAADSDQLYEGLSRWRGPMQ